MDCRILKSMSNDIAKVTLDVVRAAMALAERDVELKHIDVDDIRNLTRSRFAPVERKHAVALLKAQGKSNREIAKELEVSHDTVNNDVREANGGGRNRPEGGRKRPETDEYGKRVPDEAKPDKIRESNDLNEFIMNCHTAAAVAVYSGCINDRAIAACRKAAEAWSDLLRKMETQNGKASESTSKISYLQAKAP